MKCKYIAPNWEAIELSHRSNLLVNFSIEVGVDNIDWEGYDGDDYWIDNI